VQVKQGKLNYTSMMNTPEGSAVLTGIFSIWGFSVKVLLDSGATHSFINEKILNKLGLKSCHMNRPFLITTPGGWVTTSNLVTRVPLELGSKVVPTNILALSLEGIDVILGMDWLTQHQVILDIATRMVEIHSPTSGHTTLFFS
jgi:predicted aspartyl protease